MSQTFPKMRSISFPTDKLLKTHYLTVGTGSPGIVKSSAPPGPVLDKSGWLGVPSGAVTGLSVLNCTACVSHCNADCGEGCSVACDTVRIPDCCTACCWKVTEISTR